MHLIKPPHIKNGYIACPDCSGCLCDYDCVGVPCECAYFSIWDEHKADCEGCECCTPVEEKQQKGFLSQL